MKKPYWTVFSIDVSFNSQLYPVFEWWKIDMGVAFNIYLFFLEIEVYLERHPWKR